MHIRDLDFEPFAFRINAEALPELVEGYQPRQTGVAKGFDYAEVSEAKHREALQLQAFIHKENLNAFISMLSTTEVFGKGFNHA